MYERPNRFNFTEKPKSTSGNPREVPHLVLLFRIFVLLSK